MAFYTVRPGLAKEWHPTKNAPLTPGTVLYRSVRKVWWICVNGHQWQEVIAYRTLKGRGCPVCVLKAKSKRVFYNDK